MARRRNIPLDEITKLYDAGFGCCEIGKRLDCHASNIQYRLNKAGYPRRTFKEARDLANKRRRENPNGLLPLSEIIELYKQGYGCKLIARLAGVSPTTVYKRLRRAGIGIRTASEAMTDKTCRAIQLSQTGGHNSGWKGGRFEHGGYVLVWKPEHPNANKRGYILEHRLVLSEKLGRPLMKDEVGHHLNGIKNDNRPENLCALFKPVHPTNPHHLNTALKRRIRELESQTVLS